MNPAYEGKDYCSLRSTCAERALRPPHYLGKPEGLHSQVFVISESPSIVEKEVQKGSCQYAKDIGKKIINVHDFGQKPQDENIGKQSRAGKDMVLKHSFKIF
jgi:hypothetical protein